MIPAWLIAVAYLVAAVVLVGTVRADFRWVSPARLFLGATLVAWAVFYMMIVFGWGSFDLLRILSRWLHLPTAIGVILIAGSRWYHEQKWGNSE